MNTPDPAPPVFLDLLKIRLPLAGWVSILHRISGVLLFLAIPGIIYLLQLSLSGDAGFERAVRHLHTLPGGMLLALLFWAISHHFLAGVRHLLLDLEIGMDRPLATIGAWIVMLGAPVLAVVLLVLML